MEFTIGSNYDFEVYAPNLLGNNFKNVLVKASMDYDLANQLADISPLHRQQYPALPAGTPDDPRAYTYIQIEFPNGDRTVIGLPWIRNDSIVLVEGVNISIKVLNAKMTDADRIRELLLINGFESIEMTVVKK